MYKRKFNLPRFLVKWIFTGIFPWIFIFLLLRLVKDNQFFLIWDEIKASIAFSFIPYFGLPHFFKLLKELWELWKEGNWILKIILPMGMLGVVGRVIWMMINDLTFKNLK